MDSRSVSADVFTPTTADELARFVTDNASGDKRPLFPVGGRTALHYGYPPSDNAVSIATSGLNRVIDYPARDMTITVEAGMRVEDLQKRLAVERQRLPVDIPQAHRATVGGAIATNTSGPGRFGHGTFRDYVIGISAVDGQGRLFSAGGRVVKNVAGYDLCKLLVGSMGTLGIITQVTLKLRPLFGSRQCVWATFGDSQSIDPILEQLLTSETRPTAIEVLTPTAARLVQRESKLDLPIDSYVLCLAFEGSLSETTWQVETVRQEMVSASPEEMVSVSAEESGSLWSALTEYQAASDDPLTFHASLPPSAAMAFVARATEFDLAIQCHAGNGILVGHLPDRYSSAGEAASVLMSLREFAAQHGGSLVVLACDDDWKGHLSIFGEKSPSSVISANIKAAMDPLNLLSPGRMVSGGR